MTAASVDELIYKLHVLRPSHQRKTNCVFFLSMSEGGKETKESNNRDSGQSNLDRILEHHPGQVTGRM